MTKEDAMYFPFIASGFLFGLYLIFKIFGKVYANPKAVTVPGILPSFTSVTELPRRTQTAVVDYIFSRVGTGC
jgi:hypothetical protein